MSTARASPKTHLLLPVGITQVTFATARANQRTMDAFDWLELGDPQLPNGQMHPAKDPPPLARQSKTNNKRAWPCWWLGMFPPVPSMFLRLK